MDIIESINAVGPLACVYFATMSLGVLYALVLLLGGEMGHAEMDLSVDAGPHAEGSWHGMSLSPVALAGFVTAFGAFGLITEAILGPGTSVGLSLLVALIGGLVVGGLSQIVFYSFIVKSQGSSEVTRRDVVGATGEVLTPIPAGGLGEVAFVAQGARVVMTARGAQGEAIGRGSVVWIVDQVGSVALVVPVDAPPVRALPPAASGAGAQEQPLLPAEASPDEADSRSAGPETRSGDTEAS